MFAGWTWPVLLVGLGVVLLAVEIVLIPGLTAAGVAGVLAIGAGLYLAWAEHGVGLLLGVVVAGTLVASLGLAAAARFVAGRLVLGTEERAEGGYAVSVPGAEGLVGAVGRVVTDLRPSGAAVFGDARLDVVADGQYIEADAPVRVTRVEGSRIVVERV